MVKRNGKDKTIDLCSWFNEQSCLTARINTIKVSVDECLQELRALGWTVDQDEYIPNVFISMVIKAI